MNDERQTTSNEQYIKQTNKHINKLTNKQTTKQADNHTKRKTENNKRKQTNELQHQDMFLIDGDTRTSIKSIVIGYGWGVTGRVDIDAR